MPAPWLRAAAVILPIAIAGCVSLPGGAGGPVASAELGALFEVVAYPDGQLVGQEIWDAASFGPIATPGNRGARIYLVEDSPREVQAHYIALAKDKGWTFAGPGAYDHDSLGRIDTDRYYVQLRTFDRQLGPGDLVIDRPRSPDEEAESPPPAGEPQSGPYNLRIEAGINF